MADIYQTSGSTLASNLMSKGIVGGVGKTLTDVGKKFTLENMANAVFSGDDIFSQMGKKAFGSKKKGPDTKVSKEIKGVNSSLQSILQSSSVLPNMAKDVSIIAQNMQQLVELSKPDADDFFRQEDLEESQLESENTQPIQVKSGESESSEDGKKGGLLGLVGKFGAGISAAFKKVFNFKNILKVFKKIFLPIAIIGSLFSGIKDGFERYKKTESISEAIFAGLGGVLEFLTFGFFGEDTIRNIYDNLSKFYDPVANSIKEIFGKIKSFFAGIFGRDIDVEEGDTPDLSMKPGEPEIPDNLKTDNVDQIRDNMVKTSTSPQQQDGKAAVGNFLDNTGASQMLGNNIMPMMGNIKSGTGTMNPGDMAKQGFGSMFGGMGKGMGVDAGALTGDLKGGIQGIKNSEDKQAGLMSALGNLASNPAVQNFRGKPSDEASRMENVNQASSGLSSLLGGAMGNMGIDTKSLQDQYGSKPMAPQKSSPSIYDKGGTKGPSGGDINERSSNISEGQRMEAAADYGDVVNNSTTNTSKGSTQNTDRKVADVVNKDLFLTLNLGNALPDSI